MPAPASTGQRSSYIKRPVPAQKPLGARLAEASMRAAGIALTVTAFIGLRMAWRGELPAVEQLGIDAAIFAFVFMLAMLAQVFGAKPAEGSKTGNLELPRGFAIAVIAAIIGGFVWMGMALS